MKIVVDSSKMEAKLSKLVRKFPVELSRELNNGARAIILDIKQRVAGGKAMPSGKLKKLPTKTIEAKRKAGMPFPEFPLIGTGAMSGALMTGGSGPYIPKGKQATPKKQLVEIHAPNVKAPYGKYHSTAYGNRPARPWFGISKDGEKKANKSIVLAIKRLTRAR